MMWKTITVIGLMTIAILATKTMAQQSQGTDPIFWCDISRSQVSHERDAALAQIEVLKLNNATLAARVKELEARAAQPKETKPNE